MSLNTRDLAATAGRLRLLLNDQARLDLQAAEKETLALLELLAGAPEADLGVLLDGDLADLDPSQVLPSTDLSTLLGRLRNLDLTELLNLLQIFQLHVESLQAADLHSLEILVTRLGAGATVVA